MYSCDRGFRALIILKWTRCGIDGLTLEHGDLKLYLLN